MTVNHLHGGIPSHTHSFSIADVQPLTWSMSLAASTTPGADGWYALLAPEGVWSSDGRMFAVDGVTVREGPNELPLMGLVETTEEHDRAVSAGHFTRAQRRPDGWWEAYGVWADTPEADNVRRHVRAGDVTGVSVDMGATSVEYLTPADQYDEMVAQLDVAEPAEPERVKIDGVEYIIYGGQQDRMRATAAELMGATIVPFPAFGGATITDLQPDAPLTSDGVAVLAAAAPAKPPAAWFRLPGGHTGAYDVEIDDDGRIHGYPAATWDTCHLSFPNECVTPPHSITDYAYFRVGPGVPCADGSRVRTGPLTLRGGHADPRLSASKAMAHYDDTDSAFADVNIGEDEHGIWIAGVLRPGLSAASIRTAMGSGFSGDWRPIGGNHELIALSAVNTPGFRNHASLYERDGLVASMILDMARAEPRVLDAEAVLASAVCRIASTIGRSPEQRILELRARVHAGDGRAH